MYRWCLIALLTIAFVPRFADAQPKTLQVRGQRVQLDPDPNFLLVRPEGNATYQGAANSAIRVQAQLVGEDATPYLNRLARKPATEIMPLNGVLVPRVIGLDDVQVQTLAGMSEQVGSSQAVFRVANRLVIPMDTLTVRFQKEPTDAEIEMIKDRFKLEQLDRPTYASNVFRFQLTAASGADTFAASELIQNRPEVLWAEADLVQEIQQSGSQHVNPNDPFFHMQWYLQMDEAGLRLPEAWAMTTGTEAITVAVIDDGVDLNHEDLRGKLVPGYDFFDDDPDPQPESPDAHGTACAAIIGATTNNDTGVSGISWHCKILPVRIAGQQFATTPGIAPIEFAGVRAQVLSCSWGGGVPTNQVLDAIDNVTDAGRIVVAAAGNARPSRDVFFPASYERCIAVGSVDRENLLWDYSCYGPDDELDLVAPSGDVNLQGDIWTADHSGGNGYNDPDDPNSEEPSGNYTGHFGGTSAATPVVAGVIALVWSINPELTAAQVREMIESTATKVDPDFGGWVDGYSKIYGRGKINPVAALAATMPCRLPPTLTKEQERRLALINDVISPQAKSFNVGEGSVKLTPNRYWVVVGVPTNEESQKRIRLLLRRDVGEFAPREVPSSVPDLRTFLVPKASLAEPEQLKKLAEEQPIPDVYPIYESAGTLMVPLGTFTCRLGSTGDIHAAETLAKQSGVEIVSQLKDKITFRLTADSSFKDIFEAVRAFNDADFTRWCEPDFAVTVDEFQKKSRIP